MDFFSIPPIKPQTGLEDVSAGRSAALKTTGTPLLSAPLCTADACLSLPTSAGRGAPSARARVVVQAARQEDLPLLGSAP